MSKLRVFVVLAAMVALGAGAGAIWAACTCPDQTTTLVQSLITDKDYTGCHSPQCTWTTMVPPFLLLLTCAPPDEGHWCMQMKKVIQSHLECKGATLEGFKCVISSQHYYEELWNDGGCKPWPLPGECYELDLDDTYENEIGHKAEQQNC